MPWMVVRRFVACGIDIFFIAYLPVFLFGIAVGILNTHRYSDLGVYMRIETLVAAYFIFFWTSRAMATPGMRMTGIVITSAKGGPITLAQACVRYIFFSLFVFWLNRCQFVIDVLGGVSDEARWWLYQGKFGIFLLLWFPVLYTRRQQGLPDLLARTEFREVCAKST